MAAQAGCDPLTRVCAYCRIGIHSSALFAECTYCRLPYCISCRFEHQPSHQQAVVIVRSVVHQFEVNGETEVCARCSKHVSFSYACCECRYALCRSCWFDKDINMHQHKVFNVIETPRLVKSKPGVADACCTVAAVNHCSTCSAPFSLGQETIFCKTCYLQSNESVYLCVRCYISSEESHPRHHESWQWTVEIAKPGGLARGIHCNECFHAMRSVQDLKAHPHTSYAEVYTEKHLNQVIARSYRQCQKKSGRVDDMMAEGGEWCTMCLQKTVSSSFLPCQQCNETNRLCAHCEQHASKLHIHKLPAGDSSGNLRPSSANVIQNIPVDTPSRSSISLQPLQSPIEVRTRSSPVPSPVSSPIPTASHHSPSPSPYRAIQPSWNRLYDENEPYSISGASQYPLQRDQNVTYSRSVSDPTVTLPRSHTPPGSPQPYPRGPPQSRPAQQSQQLHPGKSSLPASPPTSPQPNPTGSSYRVPTQPSQPKRTPEAACPTPPISPQPNSYQPSYSGPAQPPQPTQSSHSASPLPPTSVQPNPTRPSHSKPAQTVYPRPSPQPAYPTPPTSCQPKPTHSFPTSRPAPTQHPIQHPQPPAPTTPDRPTTPPLQRLSSAPEILVSTPQDPQEEAIPQQKRNKFAGFKAAYDVTQKNAATRFVTRVAAKTAFGAVTNVIGADLSNVIDGAGGLNLGGTGIDAGSIVGNAVTSAANDAFDEAIGEDDRDRRGGGRWKNLKPNVMGRQGARLGGGRVNQDHITQA